ncbi:MAG: hypothetical protein K2J14_01165, partial [Treponemataceae bacterium]|nr:hypothetical protein [Treponemataceae bacterium]
KKISKLALLAAATAFLLAAFPACSDEDDGNEPTPTVKPGDGEGDGDDDENGGNGGDSNTSNSYVLNVSFSANEEIQGTDKEIDDVVTVRATAMDSKGEKYQKIKLNKNGYIEMGGAQAKPNYGLEITFSKAATVKTKVTKKSSTGTATKAVLVKTEFDADGKTPIVVAQTDGIDDFNESNTAASVTERTIEVTEPGTYVFGADSNGCFVYSLVINWKD